MPLLGFSRFAGQPSRIEVQPDGAVWLIPDQATTAQFSDYVAAHTVKPGLIDPDSLFAVKEIASIFTGGGGGTAMFDSPPGDDSMANGNYDTDPFGVGADAGGWGDYTPPDDTTIDPGFGSGGADIDLSGALNLGTSILSGGGGQLMRTAGTAQAMGAVGGLAVRMSSIVAGAILKLKQTLGGGGFLTAGGIASFGRKTWAALSAWAARNPSVSIVSTLVGLGLTVEEAAHFISWGVTHKRKRRARGITGTDLRTTGRTIRKLTRYQAMLRTFCGGRTGGFPARHRHRVTSTR